MDISVHCDINIFEWLMRWVKKDQHMDMNSACSDPSPLAVQSAANSAPVLGVLGFLFSLNKNLICLSYIMDVQKV